MMPGATAGESLIKEDPTHFTIVCREKLKDGNESDEQYEFSLYPSGKVEEQFKFEPNHTYKMEIAINGIPDDDNPFFKVVGFQYLEESNSYMIRRDTKDSYAVPLSRINKFWNHEDKDNNRDPEDIYELTDDVEWVAEVIWQDTPVRLIDFASFKGYEVAPDKSHLEGAGDIHFAFRTTGNGEGNVIVGVREKVPGWEDIPVEKRKYLWSWHLWITDYAPDELKEDGPYDWSYHEVPGGAVHRYPDTEYWFYMGQHQYIMDRDLGATSTITRTDVLDEINAQLLKGNWAYRFQDLLSTFGMYYQYGRKDPFPYSQSEYQPIYDIYGNTIPAFNNTTNMIISEPNAGSIDKSVWQPYIFYRSSTEADFWNDVEMSKESMISEWFYPEWYISETGKSIYDPCPPGWRVLPDITVFGDDLDPSFKWRIHHYRKVPDYWLASYIDLGDGHIAFFPASGRRDNIRGRIDYHSDSEEDYDDNSYFRLWPFSGMNEWWTASSYFQDEDFQSGVDANVFAINYWNYSTGESASAGAHIRCIRDVGDM